MLKPKILVASRAIIKINGKTVGMFSEPEFNFPKVKPMKHQSDVLDALAYAAGPAVWTHAFGVVGRNSGKSTIVKKWAKLHDVETQELRVIDHKPIYPPHFAFKMVPRKLTVEEEATLEKIRSQWKAQIESSTAQWRTPIFKGDGREESTALSLADQLRRDLEDVIIGHEHPQMIGLDAQLREAEYGLKPEPLHYRAELFNTHGPGPGPLSFRKLTPEEEVRPVNFKMSDLIPYQKINLGPILSNQRMDMDSGADDIDLERMDKAEDDSDEVCEFEKMRKSLDADTNVIRKSNDSGADCESTESYRKRNGLCPQCGEKGGFVSFQMTCSKHGPY